MHKLSVGAMFKNERHALVEWVEHYLFHGAEHFYLIDDASSDGGAALLEPYVRRGVVDYVRDHPPYQVGRMQAMYDKHVLPHLRDSEWLLICDLDEFIWSPHAIDLNAVLKEFDREPAVWFSHTLFGSNGHVAYPKGGIVESYTRREAVSPSAYHLLKYFVNGRVADVEGLFNHWPILRPDRKPADGQDRFVFNHYLCQCEEWWRKVKSVRGIGAAHQDPHTRDMHEFRSRDKNEVEDVRLRDQNLPLIERLRKPRMFSSIGDMEIA
jgi:hypothetical protein